MKKRVVSGEMVDNWSFEIGSLSLIAWFWSIEWWDWNWRLILFDYGLCIGVLCPWFEIQIFRK